ncbi:MAG: HipA domain-containing protein, partial [Wenzhouxiangella sp.]
LDMRKSVENEHFCLTLCGELGLEVPRTDVLDFEDVRVLCIQRFDRIRTKDGRLLRIPQEDFCQALSVPPTRKYNRDGGPGILDCLDLLNGSDNPQGDRQAFLKAQIVFWLLGAPDGHAKNFSLFLTPGGRYRMTPLYDVMSVQPNYAASQIRRRDFRMAMAVGDNRHYRMDEILPRHFRQSAKAAGLPEKDLDAVFAEFGSQFDAAFERAFEVMPKDFPDDLADAINQAARQKLQGFAK